MLAWIRCRTTNGAVITLPAVTGLTHRQSYADIFAITCIKPVSVFFVIAVYDLTGSCRSRARQGRSHSAPPHPFTAPIRRPRLM
jgi:hypothetical protein